MGSVTRYGQVARQMQIFRGCIPLLYEKERDADWMKDVDDRVQYAIDFGKRSNFIGSRQRCRHHWMAEGFWILKHRQDSACQLRRKKLEVLSGVEILYQRAEKPFSKCL